MQSTITGRNLRMPLIAGFTGLWLVSLLVPGCGHDDPAELLVSSECLECEGEALTRCEDGEDNDRDGLLDCEDPDCAVHPNCGVVMLSELENTAALCANGLDDDGNGYADCDDFECQPTTACSPAVKEPEGSLLTCSDGLDNDGDGDFDCQDEGCAGFSSTCEASDATCSDGVDNDQNGYTDCHDFSCSKNSKVTVCTSG